MPRQKPEIFTLKHLVPHYYGPKHLFVRWFLCLPQGLRVYIGDNETEVVNNLKTFNQLALLTQNRWRGVREVSVTQVGEVL